MTWIKKVYLYLVSLIALVIIVVGSIMLINLALKQWVFTKADLPYRYIPPAEVCEQREANGENLKPMAECDPEYLEKQEAAERDNRTAQKQRNAANAIAMILVASPVFWYHWRLARRES